MEQTSSFLIKLFMIQSLSVLVVSQNFDFFYFVQQWPGSYCDTKQGCCFPQTGKPASNFGIIGLRPSYKSGSYPSNCDPKSPFDQSKISDLTYDLQENWPSVECPAGNSYTLWEDAWDKHGTCSQSVFNQHDYFAATLKFKKQVNLLQILTNAGIKPNGASYALESIKGAIKGATGHTSYIECNIDKSGNSQLYQIYMCVDHSGAKFIECSVFPQGSCASQIHFPSF